MRVLGIDPGLTLVGYGVINEEKGKQKSLTSGCISIDKQKDDPAKLKVIYNSLNEIIQEYLPQVVAIEKIFFNKNVTTAIRIGEARGVILLVSSMNELPVYEYTPLQIKQVVAGYGKAPKKQVEKMVQLQLGLHNDFTHDDEADALAVSLCHLFQNKWRETVEGR